MPLYLFLKLKAAFENLPVEVTIDSADDDSCVGCRFTGYEVNRLVWVRNFWDKNCFKTESGLAKVR